MKAIVQRVLKASVTVDEKTVGSIGKGLCVLVGIHRDDTDRELEYIIRKILNTKLFDDDSGKKWKKSVVDLDLEVLCVSQFTLEATLKGNSPDFRIAMGPDRSKDFYNSFMEQIKSQYKPEKIQDGAFGEYMQVHIQNDGPITLPLECTPVKKEKQQASKKESSSAVSSPGDGES